MMLTWKCRNRLKKTGRPVAAGVGLLVIISSTSAQSVALPDSLHPASHTVSYQQKRVAGKSFILPALLITAGALRISGEFILSDPEIKEEREESFKTFHTSIDNYLQFAPIAAGYALLINSKQHRLLPYTEKTVLTEIIVTAAVQSTKRITKVTRPDGEPYSFPSGHTAQAFAGATLFCDEFAQHNTLLTATVYSGAAAVGVLRILNNRHWASDVIAGAGFGMLSAKVSEWIIEPHHKRKQVSDNNQF